ncbi:MAG: transposase, partial [Candidatus Tectomicrobia bacterium]
MRFSHTRTTTLASSGRKEAIGAAGEAGGTPPAPGADGTPRAAHGRRRRRLKASSGAYRFVKAEPPSDADIAKVLQKISHRVIRKLRHLGYLEAGMEVPVATGYDPLLDNEPELARTMAASVKQRIAFGERAGEKVRRIGSGFGYEGERPKLKGPRCASVNGFSLHANTDIPAHRRDQLERLIRYTGRGAVSLERLTEDANGDLVYLFTRPWSDGTTGIKLSPLELLEKLAAIVPLPRAHLVRYAGCLAPHSKLRGAIIPTPRQQGVDGNETKTGTPYW